MAVFADLPLEIRRDIYRLIIENCQDVGGTVHKQKVSASKLPLCLHISRRIRMEAEEIVREYEWFEGHLPAFKCRDDSSTRSCDLEALDRPALYIAYSRPFDQIRNLVLMFKVTYHGKAAQQNILDFDDRAFSGEPTQMVETNPVQMSCIRRLRIDILIEPVKPALEWELALVHHDGWVDYVETRLQSLIEVIQRSFCLSNEEPARKTPTLEVMAWVPPQFTISEHSYLSDWKNCKDGGDNGHNIAAFIGDMLHKWWNGPAEYEAIRYSRPSPVEQPMARSEDQRGVQRRRRARLRINGRFKRVVQAFRW